MQNTSRQKSTDRPFLFGLQAVKGVTWSLAGFEKLFGGHGFDGGAVIHV